MKVVRQGDFDYIFFINNLETEKLENSSLEGKLYNKEFPYECLGKRIILRFATDNDVTSCGGSGSNFERTEFWIKEEIYDRLRQKGAIIGSRYDSGGSKIDIINYDVKKDWYEFLMRDLNLI